MQFVLYRIWQLNVNFCAYCTVEKHFLRLRLIGCKKTISVPTACDNDGYLNRTVSRVCRDRALGQGKLLFVASDVQTSVYTRPQGTVCRLATNPVHDPLTQSVTAI